MGWVVRDYSHIDGYTIVNTVTGEHVGHADTEEKAYAQVRARNANYTPNKRREANVRRRVARRRAAARARRRH
jgi:hypothetical protein